MDDYYAVAVADMVVIECGVNLGELEDFYIVDWYKDGISILNIPSLSPRVSIMREVSKDLSLEIERVMLTDSGNYVCEVVVDGQLVSGDAVNIKLVIYGKPFVWF